MQQPSFQIIFRGLPGQRIPHMNPRVTMSVMRLRWRVGVAQKRVVYKKQQFQLIRERTNDFQQALRTSSLADPPGSPFSSSAPAQPQTVLPPYTSELPNYLIALIDAIIKADELQVLRFDFLHYSLEELVTAQTEPRELIWLFTDPDNQNHLLSKAPHPLLPPKRSRNVEREAARPGMVGEGDRGPVSLVCCNILAKQLQASQVEDIARTSITSIDQLRAHCQANLYTSPLDFERDLRKLIAWNQVFRAGSFRTFEYITILYERIINILMKRDIFRRFYEIKQADLARLVKYQTQYKTNVQKWPIVPSSFREYEEIDKYEPTPPQRIPIINERLGSQKVPVDCDWDCVCLIDPLPQGVEFCTYSLLNGWESGCPNRKDKIECSHADEEKQRKCRNGAIRKHDRKVCAGKAEDNGERPAQIEERLTWGIDLFTRNIIYHCLPEFDIQATVKCIPNQSRKNYFIENTLARALNFMGAEGYNLLESCNYIKAHAELPEQVLKLEQVEKERQREKERMRQIEAARQQSEELLVKKEEGKVKQQAQVKGQQGLVQHPSTEPVLQPAVKLFSQRDYLYADLLARNYELAQDKTGFRVHTKGKGAICIDQKGISQGSFIVQYFGEIYEPWRWYDRQDFIKQVLKKKKLKNFIPEFYNIYLEKHPDEPLGYDILVVDPSKMGNFSSRFSHSCEPNCGTVTTISQGRYFIGMYAFRPISYGEQLTFDYCSMTESNYEHLNSICLCGKQKCRGNYLQLSNNKVYNNLMDNRNCFYARNSAILKASGFPLHSDLERCAKHNIRSGFLQNTPHWIIKWLPGVLQFIVEQSQIYKQTLKQQWRKVYPWQPSESQQQKQKKRELYSDVSKHDLQMVRFQNLITSVDKIKYFYSKNQMNTAPPIYIEGPQRIVQVLIAREDSVMLELQECFINYKCEGFAKIVQQFLARFDIAEDHKQRLFLFRMCCLVISHKLLFLTHTNFNHELLSDIVYFYAFTHTYFSPSDFKSFEADEIVIGLSDILGEKGAPNQRKQRSKKKYSGPFVWGQAVSWYKQTIVCPQASLSQDRRGTLSYPLIKSIMRSEYPYEKQSRTQFHKVLLQKPANSWPPAPGCDLSFKNPYKLYGTMLFENVHSREELAGKLPRQGLLESCLTLANSSFRVKLDLFKTVELALSGTPSDSPLYDFLNGLEIDYESNVPLSVRNANHSSVGEPRKRVKNQQEFE